MVDNLHIVSSHRSVLIIIAIGLLIIGCEDTRSVPGPYPTKGLASWYSSGETASGDKFDPAAFTCALRKRGFGGYYRVCNEGNGVCVVVRHNDFGPAKRLFDQGRIVDLSEAAFSRIADLEDGLISIIVTPVTAPSSLIFDTRRQAYNI